MKKALLFFILFACTITSWAVNDTVPPVENKDEMISNSLSGKTYDVGVVYSTLPQFKVTSDKMLNGKPLYESWLLVKAKFNGVYNIEGGLQDEETFNLNHIDVYGTDNTPNLWADLYQTQVRLQGSRETEHGTFTGYLEMDFWAGNGDARIRHAWLDYKFVHFGQDWTFFGDKDIWPNVMDWDGPPSGIWARGPQLKFYKNTDKWGYEGGFELVPVDFNGYQAGGIDYMPTYQNTPDFILALTKKHDIGHTRISGVYRSMNYAENGNQDRTSGYGFSLSGLYQTRKEAKDLFQFQLVGGVGISSYMVSFMGSGFDMAPTQNQTLESVPAIGGWVTYEYWLDNHWHSNLVLGYSALSAQNMSEFVLPGPDYEVGPGGETNLGVEYILLNVMFDPVPNLSFGLEYNYGFKRTSTYGDITDGTNYFQEEAKKRKAQRISFGAFFNF